jgi:hypothetical protein
VKILRINHAGPLAISRDNIWLSQLAKRSTGDKEALVTSLIGGSQNLYPSISSIPFSPFSNPDQNPQFAPY